MLAHEVLRKAAEVVAAGWSDGAAAARDALGREVSLYGATVGGSSRARINPNAARFSLYGAVAKVLANAPGTASAVLWVKLAELAKARSSARMGGTNHVNPIIQFNADEDRTAQDVVALLRDAADELEAALAATP